MLADIALPLALKPLTYKIPEHMQSEITIGSPVWVQLRKKKISGYVSSLDINPAAKSYAIKDILGISDELPRLDKKFIGFLLWIAEYYHYPLGEVIQAALPPRTSLKKTKRYLLAQKSYKLSEEEELRFTKGKGKKIALLELLKLHPSTAIPKDLNSALLALKKEEYILETEVEQSPKFIEPIEFPNTTKITALNAEQAVAFSKISAALDLRKYKSFLLKGVTGSGKTEVYLSSASHTLSLGKSVVIMVPEIALTPQLFSRIRSRLGKEIAIFHSELSDYERSEQWNLVYRGIAKVVLGARSAIFAPIPNVGLIVVDEEHETAFKQEDRLKYNARDMALLRAHQENAVVVLGSATPSLESFHHVLSGKLELLELQSRHRGLIMPKMEVVDLRKENCNGLISSRLSFHLSNVLDRKNQAILFLNRRGFSKFVICKSCGHVPQCPNCSLSLTQYQASASLQCHYCGYSMPSAPTCQNCHAKDLIYSKLGTESLQNELQERFPTARIIRIDRETIKTRNDLESSLHAIANHEYDFIIGTQMIAKGHDFPKIELAAIVSADATLNLPDFRSAERSYQLFTQVAGRAGRGEGNGIVVIQTFNPENSTILHACNYEYDAFSREELAKRELFRYPPYFRIARIVTSDNSEAEAKLLSERIVQNLHKYRTENIEVLGPAPAVLHKLVNKYRWNILLKCKTAPMLNSFLKITVPLFKGIQKPSSNISIDVDPVSLL